MALNDVSPQPIVEPDSSSIYSDSTPPESVATDQDPFQTIQTITSSVPWPGSTYIIRSAGSANVITLHDGQILLASPASLGSIHWECVETHGWLGFRDPASGMFLGHDMNGRLCCGSKRHRGWESFCARLRPEGGYVLLMTQWQKLWPLGVRTEYEVEWLEKVDAAVSDGLVWDFVKVR